MSALTSPGATVAAARSWTPARAAALTASVSLSAWMVTAASSFWISIFRPPCQKYLVSDIIVTSFVVSLCRALKAGA
jgi:Na+-transporting NADH:ubiquinone oxidoreductase subunit NqrD